MYILKRFCGKRFERVNAILDLYGSTLAKFINLIASASYPFPEVVEALANPFHVFPSEGLPGARYFPGTQALDEVETHSETLVRELFNLDTEYHVTIQPHSGTQANQIVFNALLGPDDCVLSLHPSHGGHISHTVLVGRRNPVYHYHATRAGVLDYDEVELLAKEHHPKLIVVGSSALPRSIEVARLAAIAANVGAFLHADISHSALFVMSGHHPPVFPYADFATFNTMKNLRGPCGGVLVYRSTFGRQVARGLFPGTQGGPIENVLFAKLVCFSKLLEINMQAYAGTIIDLAQICAAELRAEGCTLIADGTDSHIVLLDLRDRSLTGLEAEQVCEANRILVNRNLVYDDPRPPWITSGLRLGTSCIATLGYTVAEARRLAAIIGRLLRGDAIESEELDDLLMKQELVTPVWR